MKLFNRKNEDHDPLNVKMGAKGTVNQVSSIINDRYFSSMGLYYDLRMLHPQKFANTFDLNARVDELRSIIQKPGFDYRPTIGLLERQWTEINAEFKNILAPKVHILLYKAWNVDSAWPTLPVYGEVDLVSVPVNGKPQSEWPMYSKWDINAIAYRWQHVSAVTPVEDPTPTPTPTPPLTPTPTPGAMQAYIICPHCGGKLIL